MKQVHETRESWLLALSEIFRGWFLEHSHTLPKVIRVSVGFPSRNALSTSNRSIGQCWYPDSARDGSTHIFISPVIGDSLKVSDVLLHELVHSVVGPGVGHKGKFKQVATVMGLTGKMTATEPSPELTRRLNGALKSLGPYPHAMLDPKKSPIKKQSTRLLKVECGDCGYTVRVTQKWIDVGLPTCPCGETMEQSE